MRKKLFRIPFVLSVAALFLIRARAGAASLTVNVKDNAGNNLAGVEIFAVEFSTCGIGPNTQILRTASDGTTTFTLTDGVDYRIAASSQSYYPTMQEFIWNPDPNLFFRATSGGSATKPLTLKTDSERPSGWFRVTITSGVGLGCFGLRQEGSSEDVSWTIVKLDAAGNGVANYHNVP